MRDLRRALPAGLPIETVLSLAGTIGARVVGVLGGLALSYWLALTAGAPGLGQFTYIQSIVGISALIARLGGDHALLRLTAHFNEEGKGAAASPYFLSALGAGLLFAAMVAVLAVPAARLGLLKGPEVELLAVLIWSLPPLVALSLAWGYLCGHRMVSVGMLLDIGTISGLTALVAWSAGETDLLAIAEIFVALSALLAVAGLAASLALALHRYGDNWRQPAPAAAPALPDFLVSGWPFAVITVSMFATQAGSFALAGSVLGDHTVGLLRATERFAILIGFALTAISPFLAPRFAGAYARSGVSGVLQVLRPAVMMSVAAAVPVAIAVALFGRWLLGTLGAEFVEAYPYLLILGLAQLIQACFGASTTALTMAGGERASMRICVATLAAACILFPMLSRHYGAYGFAIAYLLLIIAKEASTFWQIRKFRQRRDRQEDELTPEATA